MICYGIGHIGSCPIAQQQFALLLLILEEFKPIKCQIYDPVLVKEERKAIEDSGCVLLTVNEVSLPSFSPCILGQMHAHNLMDYWFVNAADV